MKLTKANIKKLILEEIQKSIQIEYYGPMSPIDFSFVVGFFHMVDPNSKNQNNMEIVYKFIYDHTLPGPRTATKIKSIITDIKPNHPKRFKEVVVRGNQWSVGAYNSYTNLRRTRSGGTTRDTIETVEYMWEKK